MNWWLTNRWTGKKLQQIYCPFFISIDVLMIFLNILNSCIVGFGKIHNLKKTIKLMISKHENSINLEFGIYELYKDISFEEKNTGNFIIPTLIYYCY